MRKDYFDRVCELPGTAIAIEDELVNKLWKNREELAIPFKKERILEGFDTFYNLIYRIHHGEEMTTKDARTTGYWNYIKHYHPSWQIEPMSRLADRQMRYKFWNGVKLYHDIKKLGMIDPLDVIIEDGDTNLYRGNRRLVILKVLGTEIAKVRYAVVNSNTDS